MVLSGQHRATSLLRSTQSPLRLTQRPLTPTEPALGPKGDPFNLLEDNQPPSAEIDEGSLKQTNDALGHLKSNMTP